MNETLTHKSYIGSVHFSPEEKIFHGRIEAIADLVTFEANSAKQLRQEFEAAVDDFWKLASSPAKPQTKPSKAYSTCASAWSCTAKPLWRRCRAVSA
jgi:predicted HicB family RNase H-like nuclease